MAVPSKAKKPREDGQITSLSGELFVAAELLKRRLQASLTFGNAKAIDILAHNPFTKQTFTVQVKSLRKTNYFLIKHVAVVAEHIYVFVILNGPTQAVQYFVVPGIVLASESHRFGKDFQHPTMPGIHPKSLTEYADAWHYFGKTDR
jgi:hypothetical protein